MGPSLCPRCGQPLGPDHVCGLPPAPPIAEPPLAQPLSPPGLEGQSYSERYRGTQWNGAPAIAQPAAPQRTRGGVNMLLVVGVLLLIGTIAGLALSFASRPPAGIVPAADLASGKPLPTPSPRITHDPRPSPSPTPLRRTPPARPSPSPADLGPMPDHPAEAFVWRMLQADASYRVVADGRFEAGNERFTMKIEMDVAGSDVKGSVTVAQKRVRATVDMIVKDGAQYMRIPGEGWVREDGPPEAMPGDIFGYEADAYDGLEYLGRVTRDGKKLHHLRLLTDDVEALTRGLRDELGDAALDIRKLRFDIWVTADGRPRSALIRFDGTVRVDGAELDMTFNFDFRFTKWGEKFVIEAPARYSDADSWES
jgi:hypothetical protein